MIPQNMATQLVWPPPTGSVMRGGQPGQGMPSKVTKVKNNEKTLLLSSDDEFQ